MTREELEQMKQEEPNSMSPSYEYIKGWNDALDAVIDTDPKQGEWIYKNGKYWCSSCGEKAIYHSHYQEPLPHLTNFCPNCGADMRVKDELNRVSKELKKELKSEIEYKAKVKELESAIAKCEKAEEDFKKRTCKFKSPTNCDFCSFHSDCDEHWEEGDEK